MDTQSTIMLLKIMPKMILDRMRMKRKRENSE